MAISGLQLVDDVKTMCMWASHVLQTCGCQYRRETMFSQEDKTILLLENAWCFLSVAECMRAFLWSA
jgi:hypothetical protein